MGGGGGGGGLIARFLEGIFLGGLLSEFYGISLMF